MNCTKKEKGNKEIAFFSIPAGALKACQEVIPKCGLSGASKLTIQERFYPYPSCRMKVVAIAKCLLGTENLVL